MQPPIEITEEYVKSLADPLISHTTEPIDTMSVLALTVQAALFEAWEMIELGEIHLRLFDTGDTKGSPYGIWQAHGQIYAGKKVIRRVAEALRLMAEVEVAADPEPDPQYLMAEALYGHPLQYALVGSQSVYVGNTENMTRADVLTASGLPEGSTVGRYNRCPTCEQWSPCDRRKTDDTR